MSQYNIWKSLQTYKNTHKKNQKRKLNQNSLKQLDGGPQLVDPPAILPDLSLGPSQGTDVTHIDHGGGEIRGERAWVGGVAAHYGISGPTTEELLVRVEEPFVLNEVLEVVVVESIGSLKIKRCQIVVT